MKHIFAFGKTFILILFLFSFSNAFAGHYIYKQLSVREGVPSMVQCVYAEKKGYVWIGTKTGLERFDGNELKRYVNHPNDIHSLPNNSIVRIFEDKFQNLWVITEKGICKYNSENDNFDIIQHNDGTNLQVNSVEHFKDNLLLGGRGVIYEYNIKANELTSFTTLKDSTNFLINNLHLLNGNTLLCGSRWQGLLLIDLKTGEYKKTPFNIGKELRQLYIDSNGDIWIATYNSGITHYNRNGEIIGTYNSVNSNLSNDVVLCIAERDSKIWIGTDGGGINILDPKTGEIEVLERIPGNNYSLPVNSILCLYNDAYDNIWAGSVRGGLINIREASMKTYTDVLLGGKDGLSECTVLSLYQEPNDQIIWIGTDGGGLNKYDTQTGKFTHYPEMWGAKVASICGFDENRLLLSLFSKGVYLFDKRNGSFQSFPFHEFNLKQQMLYKGKTVNLYKESDHTILLLADKIYRYNLEKKSLSEIINRDDQYLSAAVLAIDNINENLYIHDERGIYSLQLMSDTIKRVHRCKGDTLFNSVSVDNVGTLWIATNKGIQKLSTQNGLIEHMTPPSKEIVYSILCDKKGKVWMGTGQRIYTWLTNEKRYIQFGQSDGVLNNEYLPKPRLHANNGDIYLGGVSGLLHINKYLPIIGGDIPTIKLTKISVDGESLKIRDNHPFNIQLPWDIKNITFRIMAVENDIFRDKSYLFKIIGAENQIIETNNPELSIRSLLPGIYNITVACSAKNGEWTSDVPIGQLTILAPWYQSWWFLTLIIILLTLIIIVSFVYTLRQKENKMKWSMKEHEQKIYEDKVRFLININHELRTPLTLIYAPIKRLLSTMNSNNDQYPIVHSIYRQSHRMIELLNMVLDMRKMEVQGTSVNIEPHPLNQWIKSYSDDFALEAKSKGIEFEYNFDESIDHVGYDKDKCLIVLNNLMINALKYSPDHTTITIKTEYNSEKSMVRVSISDQGCGINDNDIDRLFDRFYQGTNSQGGSGIGLSYSKMLIELHHGIIGVYNNKEKGATFYFELPYQTEKRNIKHSPKPYINEYIGATEKLNPTNSNENDLSALSQYSLLIVDDNDDLLEFIHGFMKSQFKSVYIAKNGVEALKSIRTNMPDIVVSDVMMPLMDGYELCKEIKKNIDYSHLLVILLTARNDEQSRLLGYKNGADGYLTKPFEPDTLLEMIGSRLKNRDIIKGRYLEASILPKPEEATFSSADETFLLKFNHIIIENISNPDLEVAFICKEIGMSRASLYNKLKALTSMSINEYINKYRMEKAITLMMKSELSFTEIAEQTGFSTSRYFSTAFKQYTGLTPTQYRSQNK